MKVFICGSMFSAIALLAFAFLAFGQQPAPATPAAPAVAPPVAQPPGEVPRGLRTEIVEESGERFYRVVTPDGGVVSMQRGGPNNAMIPYTSYGAMAHDPETAKLYEAEHEAAKEAQSLVTQLRTVADEKQKAEITTKLKDALTRQFEAQQKRRALEVTKIKERLAKLEETMKKRDAAKENIIGKRLDELTGVTDELGWEETGVVPPGAYGAAGGYGAPAYPVPTRGLKMIVPRTPESR